MSQSRENLRTDGRMDRRTEGRTIAQTLTYRTLPAEARSPIRNLPLASRLHTIEFVWENFESTLFFPFIHDFTSEFKKVYPNIQF